VFTLRRTWDNTDLREISTRLGFTEDIMTLSVHETVKRSKPTVSAQKEKQQDRDMDIHFCAYIIQALDGDMTTDLNRGYLQEIIFPFEMNFNNNVR
jgi:hypothetical protein